MARTLPPPPAMPNRAVEAMNRRAAEVARQVAQRTAARNPAQAQALLNGVRRPPIEPMRERPQAKTQAPPAKVMQR